MEEDCEVEALLVTTGGTVELFLEAKCVEDDWEGEVVGGGASVEDGATPVLVSAEATSVVTVIKIKPKVRLGFFFF